MLKNEKKEKQKNVIFIQSAVSRMEMYLNDSRHKACPSKGIIRVCIGGKIQPLNDTD